MKTILMTMLFILPTAAFAYESTLECINSQNQKYITNTQEGTDSYYGFMEGCYMEVASGDICFTGSRGEIIQLLESFDENDIWGGEEFLINVHYVGKISISYEVWDGPNDVRMGKNRIYRCE